MGEIISIDAKRSASQKPENATETAVSSSADIEAAVSAALALDEGGQIQVAKALRHAEKMRRFRREAAEVMERRRIKREREKREREEAEERERQVSEGTHHFVQIGSFKTAVSKAKTLSALRCMVALLIAGGALWFAVELARRNAAYCAEHPFARLCGSRDDPAYW